MAPRTKQQEAARADLLEKDPSETHEALAEFVTEQTGYEPDLKTVQLVRVLYRPFIKSEEHQARLAQRTQEREAAEAEKEKRRAEREAKAAEKPAPTKAAAKGAAKKAAPAAKKTAAKKSAAAATTAEPF